MSLSSAKLSIAIKAAEQRRERTTTCPKCKRKLALLTLSFLSYRVAYLCRFCEHSEYVTSSKKDNG